jgi:integrase/recombinase XerD
LRAYAYDLLHFARWALAALTPQPARPLSDMTESTLLDYVRYQLDQQPKPAPQTVNRRLTVVHCLYRFHYGREIPGHSHFQRIYTKRSPLGFGRPRRAVARGLRLKQPQRVVVPLSAEQVATFLAQFSYLPRSRPGGLDVAGWPALSSLSNSPTCNWLTRKCGCWAKETGSASCRCRKNRRRAGKVFASGTASDQFPFAVRLFERPPSRTALTPAGLRTLFRHHRVATKMPQANPHRFRHYAASRPMPHVGARAPIHGLLNGGNAA